MNPHVFRAYDIRGVADRDFADDGVRDLGRALGTYVQRDGTTSLALGRDCRLHSLRLRAALVEGLVSTGLTIHDVGLVPSPVLYFAVHHLGVGGGVEITASHNPKTDNGFKILVGDKALHGDKLLALRELLDRGEFTTGTGSIHETPVLDAYLRYVSERLRIGPRRFPIVVDAGNGTAGLAIVPLLRAFGFPVLELNCEPDGRFPRHIPDPTVPENLTELGQAVRDSGAELGLSFDGDGDRLAAIDSRGRILLGDQLLILLARAVLEEVPGATVVCEVKCSQGVERELTRLGGRVIRWRVGRTAIPDKMREVGAAIGGELSGHLFFAHRYLGYDDAIYAAGRLVELLSNGPQRFEAHVDSLPQLHSTPELRRPVAEASKYAMAERAAARLKALPGADVLELDGICVRFGDAWALVRASNTQAALVLRYEAETAASLAAIQARVETEVRAAQKEVEAESSQAQRLTLDFYYDLASPHSYLAATQLEGLARRTGAEIRFRPLLLGRVLAHEQGRPARLSPAREQYLLVDVARWAKKLRVPLLFPSRYPMNTVQALRLCLLAQERSEALHQALAMRLFRAYFVDDQDLLEPRVLRSLVEEVGLPAAELFEALTHPEQREALQRATEAAIALGIFAAPSFVCVGELFVGIESLDFVEAALVAAQKAASSA